MSKWRHMRVILWLNWSFGQELVVLHTSLPIFDKFSGACLQSLYIYRFIGGQAHLLACQNEFDPQWTDINCSLLKPPHWLQACTKNLPNMNFFVCKTTNSQPKLRLRERITLFSQCQSPLISCLTTSILTYYYWSIKPNQTKLSLPCHLNNV